MESPLIAIVYIVLFLFVSLWGFPFCWEKGKKVINYLIKNSTYCKFLEDEVQKREEMILDLRHDIYDIETRLMDSIHQ
jgi:hypothetical protein